MTILTDTVEVGQCFGCNRLRIPKPWTPGTLALLRSEGRLVMYEYQCSNAGCPTYSLFGKVQPNAALDGDQNGDGKGVVGG